MRFVLFVVLVLLSFEPAQAQKKLLGLKADIWQGRFHSDQPLVNSPTYDIRVALTNLNEEPVSLDKIVGNICPKSGDCREISVKSLDKKMEIAPHATVELLFSSGKATMDLIRCSGKEPLNFTLSFYNGGILFMPSAKANLPAIELLPEKDKPIELNLEKVESPATAAPSGAAAFLSTCV